jgi:hypothetical protein
MGFSFCALEVFEGDGVENAGSEGDGLNWLRDDTRSSFLLL